VPSLYSQEEPSVGWGQSSEMLPQALQAHTAVMSRVFLLGRRYGGGERTGHHLRMLRPRSGISLAFPDPLGVECVELTI